MKNYEVTRVWTTQIAEISQQIDDDISYKKARIETLKAENTTGDNWYQEMIDELEEQINALKWMINLINSPFKIKK